MPSYKPCFVGIAVLSVFVTMALATDDDARLAAKVNETMLPQQYNGPLTATTPTEIPGFSQSATTEDQIFEELPLYADDGDRLFLHMRKYARLFIPVICCVGIIGNCMALMLLRTNYWLRRLTSNIYLCTLSIFGCVFLSTVLITWLDSTFGVPLYSRSEVGCKMLTFMAHSCDFICAWMILWISCDCVIVLFRPGILKRVYSKPFARNLVICTVLFGATLYVWCLVLTGLQPATEDDTYCGLNPEFQLGGYIPPHNGSLESADKDKSLCAPYLESCDFSPSIASSVTSADSDSSYNFRELHIFFSLLDTILGNIVPSLLIMIVNGLSIYRYRQCIKTYVLRVPPETERQPMVDDTTKKSLLGPQSQETSRVTNDGNIRSSDLTLIRSLLIVTSTFVLLNVPNYAFRLYESIFDVEPTHLWQFLFFMTYLLCYLRHAVLFYMFIFWSPRWKKPSNEEEVGEKAFCS